MCFNDKRLKILYALIYKMIRNIHEFSTNNTPLYDICIIGTGPAGIVLCAELAKTDLRICVLESGGLKKNSHSDKLRRVISEGMRIKEFSRERVVGGASTTWAGLAAPLDPIDMSERPFLKVPGWPISYHELEPYWVVASERYRFPKHKIFENFSNLREGGDLKPVLENFDEKIFIAPAKPQRFAKENQAIFDQENIDLWYNATVIRLESAKHGNGLCVADAAVIISDTQEQYTIRARVFVLATGGIENARLLLASDGLGNEHDQVGRYFMNHPKNNYGIIKLKSPVYNVPYFFGCLKDGFAGFAGLHLSENVQKKFNVLNSYIRFDPIYPWSNNEGVIAVIFLFKKTLSVVLDLWKKSNSKKIIALRDYSETGDDSPLQNRGKTFKNRMKLAFAVIVNMPLILRYAYARVLSSRPPAIKRIHIRNFMEMEPNPDNRVILSNEKDINGQYVPIVHCEASPLDRRSLIELHRLFAQEIIKNDLGILEGVLENEHHWPVKGDASHHMGTTRMGKDPETSVVNENLRVHGTENVYCAGSSVFPTSGCANPTFTLCALSIRLAEHLKNSLVNQ
jgi:choline dehydrogenase-like flavoprotein